MSAVTVNNDKKYELHVKAEAGLCQSGDTGTLHNDAVTMSLHPAGGWNVCCSRPHDIFMCFMLVLVIIEICGQLSKIGSGPVNEFFTM